MKLKKIEKKNKIYKFFFIAGCNRYLARGRSTSHAIPHAHEQHPWQRHHCHTRLLNFKSAESTEPTKQSPTTRTHPECTSAICTGEHIAVQNRTMPTIRGVRSLQIWRQMSVCSWHGGITKLKSPPEIQNRTLPNVPHRRLLPIRPQVPLRP